MCLFFLHAKTQTKLLNEWQSLWHYSLISWGLLFWTSQATLRNFHVFSHTVETKMTQHNIRPTKSERVYWSSWNPIWTRHSYSKLRNYQLLKDMLWLPDTFSSVSIYKSYFQKILEILNGCILFNIGLINIILDNFVELSVIFLFLWVFC